MGVINLVSIVSELDHIFSHISSKFIIHVITVSWFNQMHSFEVLYISLKQTQNIVMQHRWIFPGLQFQTFFPCCMIFRKVVLLMRRPCKELLIFFIAYLKKWHIRLKCTVCSPGVFSNNYSRRCLIFIKRTSLWLEW